MRFQLGSAVLLALALVAVPLRPSPLPAQQNAQLRGTFVYLRDQSDDVNRAIDQAVARMNFVTRPIARGRLRKTNEIYQRLQISHTAQQVSVTIDSRAPIVSPANGAPVKWTREDGEVLDLASSWENGGLQQSFSAEDGRRVNLYTLSPDGNVLTMQVTITSPRLPQPLVYRLRYSRAQ